MDSNKFFVVLIHYTLSSLRILSMSCALLLASFFLFFSPPNNQRLGYLLDEAALVTMSELRHLN